jgi:hypothetical protein
MDEPSDLPLSRGFAFISRLRRHYATALTRNQATRRRSVLNALPVRDPVIEFLFCQESIRIGAKRIPSWQLSIWQWVVCIFAVPDWAPRYPAGVAFGGKF